MLSRNHSKRSITRTDYPNGDTYLPICSCNSWKIWSLNSFRTVRASLVYIVWKTQNCKYIFLILLQPCKRKEERRVASTMGRAASIKKTRVAKENEESVDQISVKYLFATSKLTWYHFEVLVFSSSFSR